MTRTLCVALAVGAFLFHGASARATGFLPNALFASDRTAGFVAQLSQSYTVTATFSAGGALAGANDLAFGPNGHLYVARPDRIVELDASNSAASTFGQTSGIAGISALAFGPDGHLFVTSSPQDLIYEFDPGSGSLVRTIGAGSGLDDPRGIAFGPTGHLFVTSFAQDKIFEFTPHGDVVRTIGNGSGLNDPTRISFGPLGYLYVVSTGSGRILGFDGGTVVQSLGSQASLSTDIALAYGPDSKLYVCDATNGGIYSFGSDMVLGASWTVPGLAPSGLAFAPFRFNTSLTGSLGIGGQPVGKPKETAVLSIFPGSSRFMLLLTNTGALDQLAVVGGANSIVLEGFEVREGAGTKFRGAEGIQVPDAVAERGAASIGLRLKGKVGADGRFAVTSASGTLHRAAGDFVYSAAVKTLSPAN